MRKLLMLGILAALAALVVPSLASANKAAGYGSNCNYAGTQATWVGITDSSGHQIYVYRGTGSTGNAGTSATGLCGNVGGTGGTAEVGTDPARGNYAVLDGNNTNPGQSSGYMGVSTYEDGGSKAPCPDGTPTGTGGVAGSTNSGGCLSVKGTSVGVPIPVMCGFTSGPDWNSTDRDGCYIP